MGSSSSESSISASVVVYGNEVEEIKEAIKGYLQSDWGGVLYIVDNSPDDRLKILDGWHKSLVYIYTGKNLGYSSGHNIAKKAQHE